MIDLTAALKALHPSKPKPGLLGIPALRHPKPRFSRSLPVFNKNRAGAS